MPGVTVAKPIELTKQDVSPSSTMDRLPKPTVTTAPSPPYTTCAFGGNHTLTICDGSVLACGGSSLCEEGDTFVAHLGLGEDHEWGEPVTTPTPVATTNPGPIEVGAGSLHSLILCADGSLLSCGGGWEGVLGHGDEAALSVPRPIAGLVGVRVERIAAGGAHSLALVAGGLWSWGWNRHGQLGHGDSRARHTPCRVVAASSLRLVQVAAGSAHSLALCERGHCHTFGRSHLGQCGHGSGPSSSVDELLPRCVPTLKGLRSLSATGDVSAAMVSETERYAWGGGEPVPKLVV